MSLFDIDLRIVAAAVVLAPVGAFLIGPWAAIALRVAYIASMAPLLVFERRSRVDAPGTEAGMATLFMWGAAAALGFIGSVTAAVGWHMLA